MALMKLRRAAQLTLPAEMRKALKVKEGDYLEAEIVERGVLLRPVTVVDRARPFEELRRTAAKIRPTKAQPRKPIDVQEQEIVQEVKAYRRRKHD
jgi:AbrB family looped-hinge helix DNA binding protein